MATHFKVTSSDGEQFTISAWMVRRSSGTLRELLYTMEVDPNDPEPIPLPKVTSDTLRLLIEWTDEEEAQCNANGGIGLNSEWMFAFLARHRSSLLELVHAANYLDMETLLLMATNALLVEVASGASGNGTVARPYTTEQLDPLVHWPIWSRLASNSNELLFKVRTVSPKWWHLASNATRNRTTLIIIIGREPEADDQPVERLMPSYARPWDGRIFDKLSGLPTSEDDWVAATPCWQPSLYKAIRFDGTPTGTALPEDFTEICEFFPDITELVVCLYTGAASDTRRIVPLLAGYRSQLVSLKLYADYGRPPRYWKRETMLNRAAFRAHDDLMEQINQMTALRALTINFKGALFRPRQLIDLTILEKLDTFCFASYGDLNPLPFEVLHRIERSDVWEREGHLRLCITGHQPMERFWREFPLGDGASAATLAHFLQISLRVDEAFLGNIWRLPNLTLLHLQFTEPLFNWSRLLTALGALADLEALHLQVPFNLLLAMAPNERDLAELMVLGTVRYLQITFDDDEPNFMSHRVLDGLALNVSFPHLRRAYINTTGFPQSCDVCKGLQEDGARNERCNDLLVDGLKRIFELEHLYMTEKAGWRRYKWIADEFHEEEQFEWFDF